MPVVVDGTSARIGVLEGDVTKALAGATYGQFYFVARRAPALAELVQAERAQDEHHDHHKPDEIDDVVHDLLASAFLRELQMLKEKRKRARRVPTFGASTTCLPCTV